MFSKSIPCGKGRRAARRRKSALSRFQRLSSYLMLHLDLLENGRLWNAFPLGQNSNTTDFPDTYRPEPLAPDHEPAV